VSEHHWFTLHEIASLEGLTYGYVKELASKHQWRRTNTKPRLYHILDVLETIKPAK
jgi:hypothetical protein